MGWILLALCPGTAHAQAVQSPSFYSLKDWAPIQTWEYFAVPLGLAATLAINLSPAPPSRWKGGILFDDWARDGLRLKSQAAQSNAANLSTVFLIGEGALPFLLDAGLLTGWIHGRRDLAWEMAVLDAEALTLTTFVTETTKRLSGRERPSGPGENDSFFSGHTSAVATAATLMCLQHLDLQLLGNKGADVAVCGAASALAVTTGLLRIMSDRHYASDVIVGAAVGAGSAFLVYNLHQRNTPGDQSSSRISFVPRPGFVGFSFSGTF